jgi:PEP-CTERM/exosortase A-associated glycosyltransferase
MAVPAAVRAPVFGPLATVADRWTGSRRRSRFAPLAAFIARYAAGPEARAADLARTLGTAKRTPPGTRRELALLAKQAGQDDVALEVAASIPDDHSVRLAPLRSQLAFDAGRYTEAVAEARRARAAGVPGVGRLVQHAESHITVLTPGWMPDLGAGATRLERLRGQGTKGRILHVVSVALPHRLAGYTVRTQAVAASQIEAGLDPQVMVRAGWPRDPGAADMIQTERIDGVPYHRVEPAKWHREPDRLLNEVVRVAIPLVEELRPAVLQPASNHLQALTALAIARPLGVPVVYEVRGFWEESWGARGDDEAAAMATDRYRLTRETETRVMGEADAIVTLSEVMRDEILSRGIPAEKVVIVPNAVDVRRFRPVRRDDKLASSLGIGRGEPVVGYITTLNPYEGIPVLLEAVARLRAQGRAVKALVVGEGDEERAIRAAAHRLGVDDGTLVMPGRVGHEEIARYYSLIDVFVVPRTAHRVSQLVTPLKPFEAMALERAVVVSDLPALREIVTPGETGLTFRPEDPDDLATVLAGLLDDPALRARLGRQAREWIAAERTWTANGRRYRQLFERLGVA